MMKPLITNLSHRRVGALLSIFGMALAVGLPNTQYLDDLLVSATHSTPRVDSAAARYADCLWYVARNHGFYFIQHDVALGKSDELTFLLWQDFVQSTGNEECGQEGVTLSDLTRALSLSVAEADQHFL